MMADGDRWAIMDQLGRFARIVDGRCWDQVSAVFADEVTFNYGDGREQSGIDAMRDQFRQFLDVCGPSQHLIGSVIVTLDGDSAVSRAYVQARHQGAGARNHLFLDTHGEYVDRWTRKPQGWRIVRRDCSWSIQKGDFLVLLAPEQATA